MPIETHTRLEADGYRIDIAMRITADPGREAIALTKAARLRGKLEGTDA